jgi:hypothetical protein
VTDEPVRLPGIPTWGDALRRLRELTAQMTAAAQAVAVAGAKATPPALAQPLARYTDQLLALSAAFTTPLRRLLEEQERLVEMMAEWAEQHQHLSEQIAGWADQQRELGERMVELARPFLDQAALLENLQAEWTNRTRDGEPRSSPSTAAAKQAPAKKTTAKKTTAKRTPAKKTATRRR